MLATATDDQLQALWLSGLSLLKPHVPREGLIKTVQNVVLDPWHEQYPEAFGTTWMEKGAVRLHLNDRIQEWYEPEKQEVALAAAALVFLQVTQGLMLVQRQISPTQLSLCKLVGAAASYNASPSERWRKRAVQGAKGTLQDDPSPFADFPTECRICHRFVNSDEPDKRVHALCRVYARTVLIPQLLELQEAERIVAAGGLDK